MFKELIYLPGSQEIEISSFIREYSGNTVTFSFLTSGTTGKPKPFIFSKDQLNVSAKKSITYFELDEFHTFYLCLDIKTVAAKMLIVRAYLCGATLICGPVKREIEFPTERCIDFISVVPIQLHYLIKKNNISLRKSKILIGGADISIELTKKIVTLELNCYQSFGMTETLSHVAVRKITSPLSPYTGLDGVKFSTMNERLMVHYPELQEEPITTTDEVQLIDETHFFWKGRQDFVINSGGVKLHPNEIEESIHDNLGLETVIFGLPDQLLGEKLAMLVLRKDPLDLYKGNFSFLTSYKIPKQYQCVNSFFYLPNEKIDRIKMKLASKENEWRAIL
ncbi:MAG: AMP-binding protein [Bacteroidetes bacterium]|nr:AMP-binding protein [Bacteroidota bacterium]